MKQIVKDGFTVINIDEAGEVSLAWWNDQREPIVYSSEYEAQLEVAEHMVRNWDAVASGDKPFDQAPRQPHIVPCSLYDNGDITAGEHGEYEFDVVAIRHEQDKPKDVEIIEANQQGGQP